MGFPGKVPVKTPNIDALAARGTVFAHTVTPSPLCAPARACLATGLEYDACPVKENEDCVAADADVFYRRLRNTGYHVMGCGKFDLAKGAKNWGTDGKHRRPDGTTLLEDWGFTNGIDNSGKFDGVGAFGKGNLCPYFTFLDQQGVAQVHADDMNNRRERNQYGNSAPTPLTDFAYADNYIARHAAGLIRTVPQGEPWFIQVNFNGPHDPMDVTHAMHAAWKDADLPIPSPNETHLTDQELLAARRNYSAMTENIDRRIGELLDLVRERGELENTLVVFSSDHGEMLGEHGKFAKSLPWEGSVRVPLVMAGPGVPTGQCVSSPATILDLAATFLDTAGADARFHESRSLWPVLRGEKEAARKMVRSGLRNWRMVCDGRYKLVRGFSESGGSPGEDALFDLEADPGETRNVASERPEVARALVAHHLK